MLFVWQPHDDSPDSGTDSNTNGLLLVLLETPPFRLETPVGVGNDSRGEFHILGTMSYRDKKADTNFGIRSSTVQYRADTRLQQIVVKAKRMDAALRPDRLNRKKSTVRMPSGFGKALAKSRHCSPQLRSQRVSARTIQLQSAFGGANKGDARRAAVDSSLAYGFETLDK